MTTDLSTPRDELDRWNSTAGAQQRAARARRMRENQNSMSSSSRGEEGCNESFNGHLCQRPEGKVTLETRELTLPYRLYDYILTSDVRPSTFDSLNLDW